MQLTLDRNHTVDKCPQLRYEGRLRSFHDVDDNTLNGLETNYQLS